MILACFSFCGKVQHEHSSKYLSLCSKKERKLIGLDEGEGNYSILNFQVNYSFKIV